MSFGILRLLRVLCLALVSIPTAHGQCDASTRPLTVNVTGTPQYVSTPNYPGNYNANDDCEWQIVSTVPGARILANIEDVRTESCSYDYGKLYDGPDADATQLAKFCLDNVDEFISTGDSFFLTFTSDYAIQYAGFNIMFVIADDGLKASCNTTLTPADSTEQFVMSQNIPDLYAANDSCYYMIYPTTQYYGINITMYFMDIEESASCVNDKLSFGGYANGVVTEVFAGCTRASEHEIDVTDIVGDYGVITFTTNDVDNFYGYIFSYSEVFKGLNITYPTTIDDPSSAIQVTVQEAEAVGTDVNTSLAYVDLTFTGTISWNITDATTGAAVPFTTTSSSSPYILSYTSELDTETGVTLYNVAASVTSTDVPQLTSTVYFDITVEGIDDNAPNITNLPDTFTVYRTESAGYVIMTVTVTDSDVGTGSVNNLTIDSDTSGVLSLDSNTGVITLAQTLDSVTASTYVVNVVAQGVTLQTTHTLTLTIPPDSPPQCTHSTVYTDPLDSTSDGADTYVDYTEEWSCTDDNNGMTFSISSVTPTLATPLFGIESDTGELYLLRAFDLSEAGADRKFVVVTLATDSLPQSTTITQYLNVTSFNCYPNPQNVYARMDYEPDTVLSTDFNCSTNDVLSFIITSQYPSNTFEMQTSGSGSYALLLKEKVYKIRFYSLFMLITDGTDYVPVKFNVVVQTDYCSPEDVS